MRHLILVMGLLVLVPVEAQKTGVELANLTWVEAEKALAGDPIVVIPLGAASKEHGPTGRAAAAVGAMLTMLTRQCLHRRHGCPHAGGAGVVLPAPW
jgi:hypothetical protein